MKTNLILILIVGFSVGLLAEVFEHQQLPPLNSKVEKSTQPNLSNIKTVKAKKKLKSGTKKDMTNEEIDHIFISFSKQREKEKMEREKKALMNSHPLRASQAKIRNKKDSMGNPVLPHSPQKKIINVVSSQSPKEILAQSLKGLDQIPTKTSIDGISCDTRGCVAFTPMGVIKKGDFLNPTEKILKITPSMIVTSLRKIKF